MALSVTLVLLSIAAPAFAKNDTTSFTCSNVTVLHDVKVDDWWDACLGLEKAKDITTEEGCKTKCWETMTCSVWQFVNKHKKENKTECWTGVGHGCHTRAKPKKLGKFEEDLIAGQRIQHGFVKEGDAAMGEVMGLKHIPMKDKDATEADKIARCKQFCEVDVTCTVWQYGGKKDECYMEHTPGFKKGEVKNNTWAKAGSTLEHTCPPYVAPEEGSWLPWIITGIVLAVLALAAILYVLLSKKPKVKKTRAVKIEPKPEPPKASVVFVPGPAGLQPVYTMIQ